MVDGVNRRQGGQWKAEEQGGESARDKGVPEIAMAVMESTGGVDLGVKVGSTSGRNLEPPSADSLHESHGPGKVTDPQPSSSALLPPMEQDTEPQQLQRPAAMARMVDTNQLHNGIPLVRPHPDPTVFNAKVPQHRFLPLGQAVDHVPSDAAGGGMQGLQGNGAMAGAARSNGSGVGRDGDVPGEGFRKDIRDLEELLSKLNPMAEEFVPSSVVNHRGPHVGTDGNVGSGYAHNMQHDAIGNGNSDGIGHGGRRVSLLNLLCIYELLSLLVSSSRTKTF